VSHNVREATCLADRVFVMSSSPGSLRDEFRVDLPRPRDVNSPEVAITASKIMAALKGHMSVSPEAVE
jgi:NitT/TauT family transport system ATP-binding protein